MLGLVGALAEAVPPLHARLDLLADRGDLVAPLASAMDSAAESPEPPGQIAVDYLVSALNLGFGLFLVRRLPGQRVAALRGLGMVGAASSFNAPRRARFRQSTEPRARQQIGVVAWALALVLLSA